MSDYPQTTPRKSKRFRLSVLQRALWSELARNTALVTLILVGIVVITLLVRLLGKAIGSGFTVEAVFVLLGLTAANYLGSLLTIALFIAVLLTFSRYYRDSEMVVWHSAGLSLLGWLRPTLQLVIPIIMLIACFSLFVSPWANNMAEQYKEGLKNRDDITVATPGIFRESNHGDRVYFIDNIQVDSNKVGNIFVQATQNGKQSIMVAKEGKRELMPDGQRYLILFNGTRYEGVPGQADYTIVSFERFSLRIEPEPQVALQKQSARTISSWQLFQSDNQKYQGELQWRIGVPLTALILVIMAIPLSFVNPRAGRSLNLILAIVMYALYNNLLNMTTSWVAAGKVSALVGLIGVHGVMLIIALLLFYKRTQLFSWRRKLCAIRVTKGCP